MFADDLTLLSRMKKGLDRLLCCLNSYALKWRIELNMNKTVIMVFGEEKNRSNIASERIWLLGDAPLKESNIWKNLGKLWHVDPDSAEIVRVKVNKDFDAISKLAKLGCRVGGLNPKIAARLWETLALPHILYVVSKRQSN